MEAYIYDAVRTPRGRVATASAYQHFGLGAPKGDLWDGKN